jgi:hypothetical protein
MAFSTTSRAASASAWSAMISNQSSTASNPARGCFAKS